LPGKPQIERKLAAIMFTDIALPVTFNVILEVYYINGRLINQLIKGVMDAGYHSVVWNADAHSSGVYFVKLHAGDYVKTQKLMLVK